MANSTYNTTTELKSFIGQVNTDDPFTETQLQASLDYAQDELDNELGTHFATGTDDTPDYIQVTNEKHRGLGATNKDYFLDFGPIPDFSATLSGDIAIGVTTITVDSTNGFPATGVIGIGSEKITYSAKDETTFTVTATTVAHTTSEEVLPYVFEISTTCSGSAPTWGVLTPSDQYDLDFKPNRVYVYTDDVSTSSYSYSSAPRIPNRFRSTYVYGHDTIPRDFKKLHLMVSAQDLMHNTVRKAHTSGMNDFKPSLVNVDQQEIEKIKNRYYQTVSSTV